MIDGVPTDLVNPNDNYWSTELYPSFGRSTSQLRGHQLVFEAPR
jgi:hypothetical protein